VCTGLAIASCQPLDIPLFPGDPDAGIQQTADSPAQLPVPIEEHGPAPDAGVLVPDAGTSSSRAACVAGAVACQACVRAASCAQGQVCHPQSGECVLPCSNSIPACPGSSVCNDSLGVCVECLGRAQCPGVSRPVCDTVRGVCVECVTADDCTADPIGYPICLPGLYRCGCSANADCRTGNCETAEGHCDD
jgi:hypothetical protein